MLTTVIIEDDPFQLELLCDFLKAHFPEIHIQGKAGLSSEGVKLIRRLQPELVLLDIDLPDKTGFEMLDELHDQVFDVIFITSHKDYALTAHQYNSSGYLVKPVTKPALEQALKKLTDKQVRQNFGNQFARYINTLKNSGEQQQKLAVPSQKAIHYLEISDLLRLEADGNYSMIYEVNGGTILSSRQIGEYELVLSDRGFFRIHDKHLINLRCVRSLKKGESCILLLSDGSQLPVSRRRKDALLAKMGALYC
ncbi:MAG TPA: LytTR family DNA-binding domain-containing protein [Bacteroidia bacterium]|nr:LytTR family DNA-binding domain-containing protein [Bacteroidia bacterium]